MFVSKLSLGFLAFGCVALSTSGVYADKVNIDDEVADALYERGVLLYAQGNKDFAKKLFKESLVRSPKGPRAKQAKQMLEGNQVKPHENQAQPRVPNNARVVNPYATPLKEQQPVKNPYTRSGKKTSKANPRDTTLKNPYPSRNKGVANSPLNPYGDAPAKDLKKVEPKNKTKRKSTLLDPYTSAKDNPIQKSGPIRDPYRY